MRLHLSVPTKVYDDGITPSHNQETKDSDSKTPNFNFQFSDPASYRRTGLIPVGIADHHAGYQTFTAVLPMTCLSKPNDLILRESDAWSCFGLGGIFLRQRECSMESRAYSYRIEYAGRCIEFIAQLAW